MSPTREHYFPEGIIMFYSLECIIQWLYIGDREFQDGTVAGKPSLNQYHRVRSILIEDINHVSALNLSNNPHKINLIHLLWVTSW